MSRAVGGLSRRAGVAALLAAAAAWPSAALPAAAADRIVSLGGAVTEILYDLDVGDRIAAIDTTSVFPAQALATKPNVGYLRQLSAEGILSVGPTLVLAIEGAGPPDALKLVEDAGVRVTHVPDEPSAAGVATRIEAVAKAVGREGRGRDLAARVATRFATLETARGRITKPVRALFILSLQNGRVLAGGRHTTADGMIALAGAENAASGIDGYKPMTDEAVIAARPDVVIMMSVGPDGPPRPDILAGPALSQTPAGHARRLVVMNGLYLLGFGPRAPEAARDLMRAFYPDLVVE